MAVPELPKQFVEWLPDVLADRLRVDGREGAIDVEANENHWRFTLTKEQAYASKPEDVVWFLETIATARESQLVALHGREHPMHFYCWHSEQDAAINFSLVSAVHGRLPFGRAIKRTDNLYEIAKSFLRNAWLAGIPIVEFKVYDGSEMIDEPPVKPLVVWWKTIPG